MPPLPNLPDWIALIVLVILSIRLNWEVSQRLRRFCLWLLRHEKGAATLQLALTLPGVLIQTLVQWLLASVMNERVSLQGWRASLPETEPWRSPFIRLTRELPKRKQWFLAIGQGLAGFALISWITADSHAFFQSLFQGDWAATWIAWRQLLATPGFWLWVYLTFSISLILLPAHPLATRPRPWLIGFGIALLSSALNGLGSANWLAWLTALRESMTRGWLGILLLQASFLASYALIRRISHLSSRFLLPQTNDQPETESDQSGHQR
ncbi:MAG: hypothetical protein OXG02_01475 [Chloroflexi bacterium]|nr:hypothetical protein [Chloroflexota bacterium]